MTTSDLTLAQSHAVQLRDGRMLGYAEYGPIEGTPVFFFHGYPGTRLEAGFWAPAAVQAGVRLIAVDRPGVGFSSFQTNRRLLDWPDDVVALASHLAIDRFAVVGFSGGGPYALACACKIPDRLTACGVVAGMVPPEYGSRGMMARNRLIFFVARRLPWALTVLLWAAGRSSHDEEQERRSLLREAPHLVEPDRAIVQDDDARRLLAADTVEAFRRGTRGLAYEGTLYARSWGFRVADIAFPALFLWHGARDLNVPIGSVRAMAEKLAHCHMTYYADDGHLSLLVNHAAEIVSILGSQTAERLTEIWPETPSL
jgi:pimeloyl-ACP methyl ester carboxylesterase